MRRVMVDGATQDALRRATIGDVITLAPGDYPDPLMISGRSGRPDEPIVVYGSQESVLGPKIPFEIYRKTDNRLSKNQEDAGNFPGLSILRTTLRWSFAIASGSSWKD